jgi:hypothetical protein
MAWVIPWVPLLLLLMIMKQSHEDSDQFIDMQYKNIDLETYIKRITELKQQKGNFYGEFEVSIYI